jgi:16S rRNA (cytosine1407-C5)-methyltransferase
MDISDKLQVPAPGLSGIMGKEFPPSIRNALRIWPHLMGTAGFFSAKMVKTAPFPKISNSSKPIKGRKPQVRSLNSNEITSVVQAFQNQYGINLNDLMDQYNLRLREVNGRMQLFPGRLSRDFNWLPWLTVGMPLGKALPDGWQPSHEFATRFASDFKKGVIQLDDQHLDTWLRGGLGKLLASRLRNLLPTRLF